MHYEKCTHDTDICNSIKLIYTNITIHIMQGSNLNNSVHKMLYEYMCIYVCICIYAYVIFKQSQVKVP